MESKTVPCPVCTRPFDPKQIEEHVNKCLFLNSSEEEPSVPPQKRKREPPPFATSKSPRTNAKRSPQTSSNPTDKSEDTNPKPWDFTKPLATQVQPTSLSDFFGQSHILGENTVLRTSLENAEIPNIILWGPPGCGKTSLSGVIKGICAAHSDRYKYASLCAANCGVKDVQDLVSAGRLQKRFGRKTVLFMDEIHRFNKKQQDIFLSYVEQGDLILVGATTENPSFTVNSALVSRCRVLVFNKLTSKDLAGILKRALGLLDVSISDDNQTDDPESLCFHDSALEWLADVSDGDARIALTNLQLVLYHYQNQTRLLTVDDVREQIKNSSLLYDRKGEEHYNIISAMHKSIRGSDDNAALYWTTRMILSGEDPLYIARRLVRAASEDIGNADPNALQLAVATMQGCHLLGMPECDCLLAQCAIYLARAPKSREADSALAAAKQVIQDWKGPQPSVPMHIRNAPTKLMKELGYGKVEPGTKPTFMPPTLEKANFFD